MRTHIIVTDSRATQLQAYIDKVRDPCAKYVKVVYQHGARYEEITNIAINQAKRHPESVIYILGGTNNITHRVYNDPDRKFVFTQCSADELIQYLKHLVAEANQKAKEDAPGLYIIFCPLTGIGLAASIKDFNPAHQDAVDQAVVEHKHKTVHINTSNG